MNISEIVLNAQHGDKEAIEELYNRYIDEIYTVAKGILNDEYAAQDAAQDAFMSVIEKIHTLKTPEAFHSWLRRIIVNRCRELIRNKHDYVVDEKENLSIETMSNTDTGDYTNILPHSKLDREETSKLIYDIVSELPEKHRTVIYMYYYSNMSVERIANELKISQGTVKTRLKYTREKVEKKVLLYEKRGIKLYSMDIFENFTTVITHVSYNMKAVKNTETIVQAATNAANTGISSSLSNIISSKTVSAISAHTASTVSHSVASKMSLGTSAVIMAVLACIAIPTAIGSNNSAVENSDPVAESSGSNDSYYDPDESSGSPYENSYPIDNYTDTITETPEPSVITEYVNVPYEVDRNHFNDRYITVPADTSVVYLDGDTVYIPSEASVIYLEGEPETSVVYNDVVQTVTVPETSVVYVGTEGKPKNRSVNHDVTTEDGFLIKIYDEINEATILDYTGEATDIVIPSYVSYTASDGTKTEAVVTSIMDGLFTSFLEAESIVFPDTVQKIPDSMCFDCKKLKRVQLGKYTTEIGDEAFSGCFNLETISGTDNLTIIGTSAFEYCRSLTSFEFGEQLEKIKRCAFFSSGLKQAALPNSLTYIGYQAFDYSDVETVTLPSSLLYVGEQIFNGCEELKEITVPYSEATNSYIENINENVSKAVDGIPYRIETLNIEVKPADTSDGISLDKVFSQPLSGKASNVNIIGDIERIGSNFFVCCVLNYSDVYELRYLTPDIETLTLPDSVKYIDDFAFPFMDTIQTINIPSSVTYIGDYSFYRCSGLTGIVLPENLNYIGIATFADCNSLTEITIPEKTRSINDYAFFGCINLENVYCNSYTLTLGSCVFKETQWELSLPEGDVYVGNYPYLIDDTVSGYDIINEIRSKIISQDDILAARIDDTESSEPDSEDDFAEADPDDDFSETDPEFDITEPLPENEDNYDYDYYIDPDIFEELDEWDSDDWGDDGSDEWDSDDFDEWGDDDSDDWGDDDFDNWGDYDEVMMEPDSED